MKNIIAPMALLVLLVVGRGASASEAIGWITILDEENDQVVLDTGLTFALSDEINFSSLADGKRVRVTYETIGGIPTVTGVKLMPAVAHQAESSSLDGPVPVCAKSSPLTENVYGEGQSNLYC